MDDCASQPQKIQKKAAKAKNNVATRKKGRPVKQKIVEVTVSDSDEDFKDTPPYKKYKYAPVETDKVKTEVSSYLSLKKVFKY